MKRIQRKRTKGFKMPENAIYVGRPTKWGNPIKLVGDQIYINAGYRRKILDKWVWYSLGDISDVIHLYELLWSHRSFADLDLQYWSDHFATLNLNELKGHDLACFCNLDTPCHADILIKLANKL